MTSRNKKGEHGAPLFLDIFKNQRLEVTFIITKIVVFIVIIIVIIIVVI